MRQFLFWVLGGLAAAAAVFFLFNHGEVSPNWIPGLFFIAIALWFWFKACPAIQPVEEPGGSGEKKSRKKTEPLLPTSAALSILLCMILTGFLFYFNQLFWGALPALVLLGLLIWRRNEVVWSKPVPPPVKEWVGICLIVGAASLLRFPFINKNYFGLQIDEANGWWMDLVVALSPASPFTMVGYGTAPFISAVFLKIFGINLAAAHASTCFMSVVAAYFFYRWCRLHFSMTSSLAASLLFTVSWWNLFFSFSGIPNIFLMTFEVGAFYFLDKGFQVGEKKNFALSGLFFGLAALTYWGGRFLPFVTGTAVVIFMVWEGGKFTKAYGRALLITLFLFLTIVGPFLAYWHTVPNEVIWSRYKELSILNVMRTTHNYFLPALTSFWTFVGYLCPRALVIDSRFALPGSGLIDGVSRIFLLLGIFLCVVNWKKRVVFLAAGGLALGITANALAAQSLPACPNYINPCRSFVILPYLFFFIARGLDWFIGQTLRFKETLSRSLGVILLSAALLYAVGENLGIYFYRFGTSQLNWGDLGFDHLQIADEIPKYYPKDHILLYYAYDNTPIRFLYYEKVKYTPLYKLDLPLEFQATKDVALFVPPSMLNDKREKLNKLYPGAKWIPLRDPWGAEFFDIIEIPKEEFIKAQKDSKLFPRLP